MNGLDKVKERIVEYPAVQQRASPHCGALYSVTCPRLSKIGSNVAKCVVCLQTMDEWDSTEIRVYKLIQRPEDA